MWLLAAAILKPLAEVGSPPAYGRSRFFGKDNLIFALGANLCCLLKKTENHQLRGIGRTHAGTMPAFTIGARSV